MNVYHVLRAGSENVDEIVTANCFVPRCEDSYVTKEEIVVMGDGANDFPMFEMSGYKVAMENGNEMLKEKADYITTTNNQDGVAKALEEIFYKGEKKA